MKYLVGFAFAITVLTLLSVINYLTNNFIPQFTVG
jgi:heme/copper-type cytochrome/quinol oxidase subunit 4